MNFTQKLKFKYRYKYITLFLIILLFIPLIGIIVTQFKYRDMFIYFFIWLMIQFIIVFIMTFIYEHLFNFNNLSSSEYIEKNLEYFSNCTNYSYWEYVEIITWFSNKIHQLFLDKNNSDNKVNKLHLVLRPGDNGLCVATQQKKLFQALASYLISSNDYDSPKIDELINNIIDSPNEKTIFFPLKYDKNIIFYLLIAFFHFIGCFLITLNDSDSFNLLTFLGNLCLYLPTDVLLLLIYWGILKAKKA